MDEQVENQHGRTDRWAGLGTSTFFKCKQATKVSVEIGIRPAMAFTSAAVFSSTEKLLGLLPLTGEPIGMLVGLSIFYFAYYTSYLIYCLIKYDEKTDDNENIYGDKRCKTALYTYPFHYVWRALTTNQEDHDEKEEEKETQQTGWLSSNTLHWAVYHAAGAGSLIGSMDVALSTKIMEALGAIPAAGMSVNVVDIISHGLLGGLIGTIVGFIIGWIANLDYVQNKILEPLSERLEKFGNAGGKYRKIFYDNTVKVSNIGFRIGGSLGSMLGLALGGIPGAIIGYLIGGLLGMILFSSIFGSCVVAYKFIKSLCQGKEVQATDNAENAGPRGQLIGDTGSVLGVDPVLSWISAVTI
ncbi:MAG: hypothetical protein V3V61_05445 [Gammaproteobacteria bacterium]